jgi:hypothetical protein
MVEAKEFSRRRACGALMGLALSAGAWAQTPGYAELDWNELMPQKWLKDIRADMAAMNKLAYLQDTSDEANQAMEKLRKKFDAAPLVSGLFQRKVRLPGYVVPLDADRSNKREFLIVPYWGACIHTPPPPANQIVLVRPMPASKVRKVPETMEVVWVEGELKEGRVTTSAGVSGYLLEAVNLYPYVAPPAPAPKR